MSLETRQLEARVRSLERALKQERTAHIAVATVVLETADNPQVFVDRIEAMARAVVQDKRTPRPIRDAVLAARDLFRRTVEQRTGRPQHLFDPDVGHVSPAAVEELAAKDAPQLSLEDPRDTHAATVNWQDRLRDDVVAAFQDHGPMCDPEMWTALAGRARREVLFTARVDLCRSGRLVTVKDERRVRNGVDWPVYDLIERAA